MSDGSISVKLAPNYEMGQLQKAVETDEQENDIIQNDGYFPDMSISDFRNQTRIDGTVTTQRLTDAMIEAMASVNHELAMFKTQYSAASLALVEGSHIHGESLLVYRYKRAVHCLAAANLYERYLSYDSTNDGEKKMELLQESINRLRRDARFAIADLLQQKRINVELL
ncbi:MAG: head completion/stabilization protein [[Pasteurella] mairii]|nr:head completion/stabilization protein [[Pasteurella] mairii]